MFFSLFSFPANRLKFVSGNNPQVFQNGSILTIVTSLDATTTDEFKEIFLATPQAIDLGITEIDFRYASTLDGWKKLMQDPSKSVDIAWGYTNDYFSFLENWNLLKPITNSTLFTYINDSIPNWIVGLSVKHYNDSNLIWFGTSFRTYGFTVNHNFLDTHDLPVPTTWEELASPIYYLDSEVDSISMCDPPYSESITRIYQIILQIFGWRDGWSVLTRIGANARLYPSSVDTRAAVVFGEVGVGFTTSSYGIIAMRENNDTEFIIPEGQSSVDICPISLGINCDNQEAAEAFLQFVASPEGQSIWLTENIDQFPLNELAFHTPLGQTRPEMYEWFNTTYEPHNIYFNYSFAQSTYEETVFYFHDTIVAEHNLLQKTWGMMVQMLLNGTINSTYFNDLVKVLGSLPENLECYDVFDPFPYEFPCPSWIAFAQDKYLAIINKLTLFNSPTTEVSSISSFISYLLIFVFLTVSSASIKRRTNLR